MLSPMTDAMLETVTLVEKSIAEGASVATYVVRSSDQRKSRVATDYYLDTANAAWQVFIDELQVGITAQEESTQKQQALLSDCKAQLAMAIRKCSEASCETREHGFDQNLAPDIGMKWISATVLPPMRDAILLRSDGALCQDANGDMHIGYVQYTEERDMPPRWYTPPRWIESGRDMYELPHVVKWIRVSDIVREIGEAGMITGDRWWTNRDRG